MMLYYVDELAVDLWASIDAAIDRDTDPVTVACTVNPDTARVFQVGDFVMFNDEAKSPDVGYRRSYECAQIVGPGSDGDVVPSGNFQFERGVGPRASTRASPRFETLRTPHAKGIRFFKLDSKTFTFSVKKGFFRTPGLPARIEAKLPTACVVAAVVGVANNFGYGHVHDVPARATTASLSCRVTGRATAARTRSRSPARSRSRTPWSSRCACRIARRSGASMRTSRCRPRTARARTAVKVSRDDGATWELLEYMGIAQKLPDGYKNTYDFAGGRTGTASPPRAACRTTTSASSSSRTWCWVRASRRSTRRRTARTGWASMWASSSTSTSGKADEEYVQVLAADQDAQTFDAIFTKNHQHRRDRAPDHLADPDPQRGRQPRVRYPRRSPTPDPGSDLTVVIQT